MKIFKKIWYYMKNWPCHVWGHVWGHFDAGKSTTCVRCKEPL